MQWNPLTDDAQLMAIVEKSANRPQVIFKHSTRCSISSMVKARLERADSPSAVDFHYLDLIAFRALSASIAETFRVVHESPQILLIRNGHCVYQDSHYGIRMEDIAEQCRA